MLRNLRHVKKIKINNKKNLRHVCELWTCFKTLGKVRFFLGGEGWGILVFFPKESVGPPSRFD